jgi:dihydroneopterin aldolase
MIRQLNINNYIAYVVLGNNVQEKQKKRPVVVNVCIRFADDVPACHNDNIKDAICYASLLNFLNAKLDNISFNLIERMAQYIYDVISEYTEGTNTLKRVEVIKYDPPYDNLNNSSFVCSDW